MKILKYGEGYLKTVVCDKCGSELEYEPFDVFCTYGASTVDGGIEEAQNIICPVCKHNIELETRVIGCPTPDKQKKRWWQR